MFVDHLFSDDPGDRAFYVVVVVVSLISIVLHELGHALAATWEGDPTPKLRGHLTWNPVVHMGWISIAALCIAGLGWGQTPVTRSFFRHRRWGEALVSFAGPAADLLLIAVGAVALVLSRRGGAHDYVELFWWVMVWWNCVLFIFNMFPIPPFDGFGVLDGLVDLGDFGRRVRGTSLVFGWVLAVVLVNMGVIPLFSWGKTAAEAAVGLAAAVLGGV
jgi:Zn-dependent protease